MGNVINHEPLRPRKQNATSILGRSVANTVAALSHHRIPQYDSAEVPLIMHILFKPEEAQGPYSPAQEGLEELLSRAEGRENG